MASLRDDRQRCLELLDRAVDTARKRGRQADVDRIGEQRDALEQTIDGLPRNAALAMEQLRQVEAKVQSKLAKDLAWERRQAVRRLGIEQADATRKGDEAGARAIQEWIEEWEAQNDRIEAAKHRADIEKTLLGAWKVTIGKYDGTWTFLTGGRVNSTNQSHGLPDNAGEWELRGDRVFIQWPDRKMWETLLLPIEPRGTSGESWTKNALRAEKVGR
ncbi:MAG: hypothetical protein ACF8XB_09010 [Planctomycetota bacterium JB042]